MKRIHLSKQEVEQHQAKHGFSLGPQAVVDDKPIPKPRMNKTETEFSMMLEAQKRRGEILEWRFEGITLAWGCDPATGKPMRYKGDFWVLDDTRKLDSPFPFLSMRIIEIKGGFIRPQDLIRFRGCRAEWGQYIDMQLHQKTKEGWQQLR